jgi:hypothetical protein
MLLEPAGASAARSAVRTRMVGLEGCGGSLPASGAQGQFGACERVLGGLWCGGYCSAFGAVHCPQRRGGKSRHVRQLPGYMWWAAQGGRVQQKGRVSASLHVTTVTDVSAQSG